MARRAPCCLLLLLNPPWRLSKTRPSRLNGKTISNIKFRFLTFDLPFRVIPSPRGSASTGPYITLLPVIPLQPVECINLIPCFAYHPETLAPPLFARLRCREKFSIEELTRAEDHRPSRMVSITNQHPRLSLSLSFPSPAISNIPPLSLLQSPTSLSTRPLLPFPPDQNRPLPSSAASSRFSTSFAPQGRKSESEIITVGSADII